MRRLVHRAATPPSQERIRYNYTKDFRCVVAADDSWFDADFDRVGLHCAGADGDSDGYISAGGGRITYGHTIAYRCANFVTNGDDCAVNAGADGYQHAGSTDVHAGAYIYAQAAAYGYAAAHSNQHAPGRRVPRGLPARRGRRVLSQAWRTAPGWNKTDERRRQKSGDCLGWPTVLMMLSALPLRH